MIGSLISWILRLGERELKQEAGITKLKQDVCNVEVRCKKRKKVIDLLKSNRVIDKQAAKIAFLAYKLQNAAHMGTPAGRSTQSKGEKI